jgi:hypothetical protein
VCYLCVWSFVRSAWRNPLAFAMRRIVCSFCLHEGVELGVMDPFYCGESERLLICVQWGD